MPRPGSSPPDRTAEFSLPLQKNEASEWEIRARIWINGCLEIGGQQAMLLARIADEFPPPEQEETKSRRSWMPRPESTDQHSREEEHDDCIDRPDFSREPDIMPEPLSVTGVPVVPFETYDQALECVEQAMEANRKSFWVAINPIKIYNAWHTPELLNLLRQSRCLHLRRRGRLDRFQDTQRTRHQADHGMRSVLQTPGSGVRETVGYLPAGGLPRSRMPPHATGSRRCIPT